MAYNTGATNTATNHNFVSYFDAHEPDISNEQVQRYGNSLCGFLDLTDAKKSTSALQFSRFEKDRIMPKIKATNGGAGLAGAGVSFTIAAAAQITSPSASPYDTNATTSEVSVPVRLNDLVMIKPASGTIVSSGNYIKAIVTAVAATGATFEARPINGADAIPSIPSADEIIIYGNAHGEGSGFQAPMSTKSTKYTEMLQIIKHRLRVTGSEALAKRWYTEKSSGEAKFQVKGEGDAYAQFMNISDLNLLVGEELSNTALATVFQTARTPLALTRGLLSSIIDGGNILNYAAIAGVTISDIRDYNVEIDAEKAQKKNLMFSGIVIDQQLDEELGDRLKNGAMSYGSFSMDQEKAVNFSFQKFTVGSYTYDKRPMESFNDKQTLGADGYGYKYEAFTVPAGSVKALGGSEKGSSIPSLRKRFLAGEGKSRELDIVYFNGLTDSSDGNDFEEVRYQGHNALEAQGINQYGYIKRV
tara:strand:+ start:17870 stop:19288 length:1419 start_codon:yes stop_codon:yes gene_type:complete